MFAGAVARVFIEFRGRHMFGSDRSWDSDWRGTILENRREDAFRTDSREDDEPVRLLEGPAFRKSMARSTHRQEAREAGRGKAAGHGGPGGSDGLKKDARSAGKDPWSGRGNEDVDAVWHRRSGRRTF
jgi:hypothetical protein